MWVAVEFSVALVFLVSVKTAQFAELTDECVCVLPVQCPAHFYDSSIYKCTLPGNYLGYCCSTGQHHTNLTVPDNRRSILPKYNPKAVAAAFEDAEGMMATAMKMAKESRPVLPQGSPSFSHSRNNRVLDTDEFVRVMEVANRALEIAMATRAFKERNYISGLQMEFGELNGLTPSVGLRRGLELKPKKDRCGPQPDCTVMFDKYRRIDGACNNLANHVWGSAMSPFARLLPPNYNDGVWQPRLSVTGKPLRSPREISYNVLVDDDRPHTDYTLMIMQFGQFLSHDITHSIDHTLENGTSISCCRGPGHFACMPIEVPQNDPFYSLFNKTCINFVRSVMAPRSDCSLGFGQQMNKVSHFLDCSMVYGANNQQSLNLRSMRGGKLKDFNDFGRELMPLSKNKGACAKMEEGNACFEAGDGRVNQIITLVAMHTIFLREHNRIAKVLSKLNPHWDDDKIFLESRRILTAELQVITYKEFLPALLGMETMALFKLSTPEGGDYSQDYNETIEPSVTNEFTAAAFRFGHSTVNSPLKISGMHKMEETISLPETMFNPGRMRKRNFLDQVLSSMTVDNIQQVDGSLTEALTKYMFRGGNPFGIDLASLNIQRGRDHGLKPYNAYRQLIGLPKFESFEEFGPELGPKLRKVYDSVDDVDLWLGGLIENKPDHLILGPTFTNIIADQFARLKRGDRLFYDQPPLINPGYFTEGQLYELRKASMSRLVCDNSDGFLLARQAPNAFRTPGVPGNEFVQCADSVIPRVNLRRWVDV